MTGSRFAGVFIGALGRIGFDLRQRSEVMRSSLELSHLETRSVYKSKLAVGHVAEVPLRD
jgi:hypothetical protein